MSEAARNLEERVDEQDARSSRSLEYDHTPAQRDDSASKRAPRTPAYDEYWRPAVDSMNLRTESCESCGSEFALGARFCHVCGSERGVEAATPHSRWEFARVFDLNVIKAAMGLPLASVIFFFVGMACTVAAAVVGFVFTATTLLDWQAVQIWRMEWLLAAVAAFVAGMLLKK